MQFGLFTCGYQHLPLEQAFCDAADFGYDYIELWGGRPHAFTPDLLSGGSDEILRLIQRYHIPVHIYTPEHNAYPYNYMLGDERQWESSIAYLHDAFRAAAAIGAQYTLVSVGHGGCVSLQQRRERLFKSIRRLAHAAEEEGQIISFWRHSPLMNPIPVPACRNYRRFWRSLTLPPCWVCVM